MWTHLFDTVVTTGVLYATPGNNILIGRHVVSATPRRTIPHNMHHKTGKHLTMFNQEASHVSQKHVTDEVLHLSIVYRSTTDVQV